jgi:hypothetical protein
MHININRVNGDAVVETEWSEPSEFLTDPNADKTCCISMPWAANSISLVHAASVGFTNCSRRENAREILIAAST